MLHRQGSNGLREKRRKREMIYLKVFCLLMVFMIKSFTSAQPKKVVVIGAGIAGLTAAYRLAQKNIDVEVYEAKPRVGGRVLTAVVDGHIAELGGQSILDGAPAENIINLINELELKLNYGKIRFNPYYVDGKKLVSLTELLTMKNFSYEELETTILQLAQTSSNVHEMLNHFFSPEDPAHKALSTMIAGYEGAPAKKLSTAYHETLMHMMLGGVSSAHSSEENEDGHFFDHVTIDGGNSLLPETLTQKLGDKVHTGMPLCAVKKTAEQRYHLTFQDGQEILADLLVLANPCSTYSDINFEADIMPADKLAAIRQVHYGTNAKVLVPLAGNYQRNIQTLDDSIGTHFNFDETVLTLYCTKDAGFYTEQSIAELYTSKLAHLKLVYRDENLPAAAPTIAQDKTFAEYQTPVGHSWPNDPYIKGSYHYIAPGQEEVLTAQHKDAHETVMTLFAPVDDTLYFAGEHASILMDVPGTMEAACESGERTARMIIQTLLTV